MSKTKEEAAAPTKPHNQSKVAGTEELKRFLTDVMRGDLDMSCSVVSPDDVTGPTIVRAGPDLPSRMRAAELLVEVAQWEDRKQHR